MHAVIAAAVAYAFGVFTPAISRKVKTYFSKETKVVETKVTTAVEAEIKKI